MHVAVAEIAVNAKGAISKYLFYKEMRMSEKAMEQKSLIVKKLKENGCRITKQRLMLLDVILEEDCASCKEIYYKAAAIDSSIGAATVYRMINILEDIGAINRKNMYKVDF